MLITTVRLFFSFLVVIFVAIGSFASELSPPWSRTIPTDNGAYILVMLWPDVSQQHEYIARIREQWRNGAIPEQRIPEAQRSLQDTVEKERDLRRHYSESGLYTAGSKPRLLWKTDFKDAGYWIGVSNDGRHMIAGKWRIPSTLREEPLEYNPNIKRVVAAEPVMNYPILEFYQSGKLVKAFSASDLGIPQDTLKKTPENDFGWMEGASFVDDENTSFSIRIVTGESRQFHVASANCTNCPPGTQTKTTDIESRPANGRDGGTCSAFAFVIFTAFLQLRARFV